MLIYRLPIPDFARWKRERAAYPSRSAAKLQTEIADARSLVLAIAPCPPFLPTGEGVELSSYYVASNRLYNRTGDGANVPVKPLIAGYGIGAYGRNGVTAIPGIGSRFAAQVLKSAEAPDSGYEWREDRAFSPECETCDLCLRACPTNALDGSGHVSVEQCLRAQASNSAPLPEASRELIGASLWGCDICQDACPRDRGARAVPMPDALERALSLKSLLRGEVAELAEWIGINYARPARMQARACLLAANLGRHDLLDDIAPLADSAVETVRVSARWALLKLNSEE